MCRFFDFVLRWKWFYPFPAPLRRNSDYFPVQHWLAEGLKPYRSSVESDSTALSVVPGPTSSSNRHVILRCFSLVLPEIPLSICCSWTMKIRDFLKINLAQPLITHKKSVNSRALTVMRSVHHERRTGLLIAMCANVNLRIVKLMHVSVLSKSLLSTKQSKPTSIINFYRVFHCRIIHSV